MSASGAGFLLDPTDIAALQAHLHALGWLRPEETILSVEKAGEGNMNCTVRMRTGQGTSILKQSRPWVEKYPHIAAPADRACIEGRYYQTIAAYPELASRMPQLRAIDRDSRLLWLEDLGEAKDLTGLYRGEALTRFEGEELIAYLTALHTRVPAGTEAELANRSMRELNHAHLFVIPLQPDNGLPLDQWTPGLQAAARVLQHDKSYTREMERLGDLYLADGPALLHGDYFPGSWLRTAAGIRIIDPEFCFYGPPEFDLGVLLAHLLLAQRAGEASRLLALYRTGAPLRPEWAWQFAGMEIMRRLIGVAQLPLPADLSTKQAWLHLSHRLVLQGRLA